jgi:iron complex outermembrane receptor protein
MTAMLGSIRARFCFLLLACPFVVSPRTWAQHASDNAVLSADDAFGLTVGNESIGLYDPSQIRGFNPQVAGNARIDGLYFDQQAPLSNRVIEGSAIRVGITAIGYPFPAPTGIVDYDLRHPGDRPMLTTVMDVGPFDSKGLDLDGQYQVAMLNLRIPMGVSYRINAGLPGNTQTSISAGLSPQWTPTENMTVRILWDWQHVTQSKDQPLIFTGLPSLPPKVPATYLGQAWAADRSLLENFGALMQARLSSHWTLRAGLFRSLNDTPVSYSDLLIDARRGGEADQLLIGYPDQRTGSTSGDAQLVGNLTDGSLRHEVVFSIRGRDVNALYDGADIRDFGPTFIGQDVQLPLPTFAYGPRTRDQNHLWMAGLEYRSLWLERGELSMGIQKANYSRAVSLPDEPTTHRGDEPWRFSSVVSVNLSKNLATYAGYTQGLEDSGVAPANANNRGEILPVTLTWQADVGLKYTLGPSVNIVAGFFDIRKPYFNLDAANSYMNLGEQRHRGFEFSIAGEVIKNLTVVAGLELIDPRVSTGAYNSQPIGPLAVGQNTHLAQINVDYLLQSWPAVSLDLSLYSFGRRAASLDNSASLPATQSADVGVRFRAKVFQSPATLRFVIQNLGNVYSWVLTDSAGFSPGSRRSAQLYLTVDF